MSGDHFTASPGKRLALEFTSARDIRVIAGNGRPGRESLRLLTPSVLKDRTVIIGVDLFFWDSFSESIGASLLAIDRLVEIAREQHVPVLIGEVPNAIPALQPGVAPLNARLKSACRTYSLARILPLNAFMLKIFSEGHVEIEGEKHVLDALLPDGLHLGEPGSRYLAAEMKKSLESLVIYL